MKNPASLAILFLLTLSSVGFAAGDETMQALAPKVGAISTLQPANDFERNAYNDAKLKAVLRDHAKNIAAADQKTADDAKALAAAKAKALAQAKAGADAKKKTQQKLAAELAALTAPKKASAKAPQTEAAKKAEADKAAQLAASIAKKTAALEAAQADADRAQAAQAAASAEAASAQSDYAAKAAAAAASSAKANAAREDFKKARAVLGSINRAKAEARMNSIYDNTYQLEQAIVANDQARGALLSAKRNKLGADAAVTSATQALTDAKAALEAKSAAATKAGIDAQAAQAAKSAAAEKLATAQKEANAAKAQLEAANAAAAKSAAAAKQAAKASDDAKLKLAIAKKALASAPAKDKEAKSALVTQAEAALAKAQEAMAPAQVQAKADAESAARAKAAADSKASALKLAAKADADALAKKNTAEANATAAGKALIQAMTSKSQRETALTKAIAAAEAAGNAREAAAQTLALKDQSLAQVRNKLNALFVPQREQYQLVFEDINQAQSDEQKLYSAAVWKNKPQGIEWTKATIAAIRANIDSLERAQDIEDFCPGYNAASTHHREVCWLRLIGALAEKESDLDPNTGFVEPTGNASVGLMALSIKECKNLDTERLVKNPLLNLSCAVGKMAQRIASDGWLAGPEGRRGASAYWSTLREPYTFEHTKPDGTSVTYHLGKKPEVSRVSKKYTAF